MGNQKANRVRSVLASLGLLVGSLPALSAAAPVVIIDAGHSKSQPGSISASGIPEFNFNLRLATIVSRELLQRGVNVMLSGSHQGPVTLTQRTQGTPGAALFVSLHHDSIQQQFIDQGRAGEFRGYSVFVSEKNPYWHQSVACASEVGRQMQVAGEAPSLYHAMPIPGENKPLVDRNHGVHRSDNLVVLKTSKAPALLVEAGVIVNPMEDRRLAAENTARRLGAAIAEGIAQCLRR